ncbi:MAG: glycerate kinase [Candidatus Gastranaerophilales bacterium]|nr:glycerate kinase [Candidatus Gastranaerophilales bacterium]
MKILVAQNYFKGSLSALNAADIISSALKSLNSDLFIIKCPLADGGDGTIESIYSATGGELINTTVNDPLFRKIDAIWLKQGKTAIIEAAKANGLTLLKPFELNPFKATTFGVGELILDSVRKGCNKVIIGVGGSATNDAGFGALRALGVRFLKRDNTEINYDIRSFLEISRIDTANIDPVLKDTKLIVATDVKNPLTGINGASMTFARQKGAKTENLSELDNLLTHFADVSSEYLEKDNRNITGAGAAGGIAYGLSEYLGAKTESGFDLISRLCGLEDKIKEADLVITGEGRLDEQSLWGKAPIKVAELAKKFNKTCIAVVGSMDTDFNWKKYYKVVYSLSDENTTVEYSIKNAVTLLEKVVREKIDLNNF